MVPVFYAIVVSLSASAARMLHDRYAGDAEHFRQLIGCHFERSRTGAFARRRLRIRGRARGVERHVAFHFLHDLMDVPVQHRHRAEAPQRLHQLSASPVPQPHGS